MTQSDILRAYCIEPLIALFGLSVSVNLFGRPVIADFMHSEARDCLSLLTVLLAASLGLWIGLFWISNTAFGQWLTSKGALESINAAYITSTIVLLSACVLCIFAAYVSPSHQYFQLIGGFVALYSLANVPTMLNNTHQLLKLHSSFGRQIKLAENRAAASR